MVFLKFTKNVDTVSKAHNLLFGWITYFFFFNSNTISLIHTKNTTFSLMILLFVPY